jgi:hypothetical protein
MMLEEMLLTIFRANVRTDVRTNFGGANVRAYVKTNFVRSNW